MQREPGYCRHKATNQAYVNLGGQVFYLGEYGSEKSKERYNRLKSDWLLNPHAVKKKVKASSKPVMSDLCLKYLEWAEKYYRSAESKHMEYACRPIEALFATLLCDDFGPDQFEACQQWWVNQKVTRQYCNKQYWRLLRVIRWGVRKKMLPPKIDDIIKEVKPLKRGRCDAPESAPVLPVLDNVVEKTLKNCTPVVADMVRFQQLVGCRPGEVCAVTPAMVDRTSDVWIIKLDHHKTAHHGKERLIYCGPKAQAILSKYLLRGKDEPCFSPAESERQRQEARRAARKTKVQPSQIDRSKPGATKLPRDAYDTNTYCRAIKYACTKAFPPPKEIKKDKQKLKEWKDSYTWSPNQLRHATATAVRKSFGLEGAQLVLGHSNAQVTQIYAERDSAKAIEIARRIG